MKTPDRMLSPQRAGTALAGSILLAGAALATCILLSCAALANPGLARENAHPAAKLDYSRDVRPILAAKCFQCHGADAGSRQAGLRLDTRDGATLKLAGGRRAVMPGKLAASELLNRISTTGPLQMPPPTSGKTLTAADRDILNRWIAQGAVYSAHWAFVKPVRPPLPKVRLAAWPRNGIDYFVLDRLEHEGLKPSAPADRTTLIRRVSLDLTGLPPTPREVDAFLADRSPNAYEKAVDRLLASPRYGERMAQTWMDCARYADSNGYQADYERFQWPWRDWVIDAYNRNLPFDRFTIEQIAGDLLPNATVEQRIATGFNRNHKINTEGGVIPEEWRVETVIDRVETTSAVWLGLTMGCGRCHDHKYDPITQREFYQFCSYFNNVPESGTGVERPVNHPPLIKAPSDAQTARLAELAANTAELDRWLTQRAQENESRSTIAFAPADASLGVGLIGRYRLSAASVVAAGSAPIPKPVGEVMSDPGRSTGAVVTKEGAYIDLGKAGDFDSADAFSYGAWINPSADWGSPLARTNTAAKYRGWNLALNDFRPAAELFASFPDDALKVVARNPVPKGKWTHVVVTYDGSRSTNGLKMYIDGRLAPVEVEINQLKGSIRTNVTTRVGGRAGVARVTDTAPFEGKVDDVAIYSRVLSPAEVDRLANADPLGTIAGTSFGDRRTSEQTRDLTRLWSEQKDPEYRQKSVQRTATAKERDELDGSIPTVMVMEEMPKPRDCFVLIRGQYDHHGAPVTAGLPAAFGGTPSGAHIGAYGSEPKRLESGRPNNQLGLAEWIVSPDNPLTARVTVNRLWEKFFGIGIVATTEDFGTRGEAPSDQRLLDWLATEFISPSGLPHGRPHWDLKAIQKIIVMSATYRQSSKASPALYRRDPDNRLLARGPRFRLPAESIRDQALYMSGLLAEKIGGPSVRPYQPDGLWDELSVYGNLRNYKHDTGDALHRRSLYTIWKRTAGPPLMQLFDVPGRETCRVRRSRTNTPLQALAVLNDVTFVESARMLAQRMITEGGSTPRQRIAYAFRIATCRYPNPKELQVLTGGLNRNLARYRSDPKYAESLLSSGDAPRDPKLDVPTLAAYTVTADILLNMDETLTRE